MGKPGVASTYNGKNLEFFQDLLRDFPYFIFYGTLLGMVRDGGIIENDDDIDFCVDVEHRQELLQLVRPSGLYQIREMDPDFIQMWRTIDGCRTVTDFYLYQDRGDYLSWRWSFEPSKTDESKHMHMDRSMLLPTADISWNDWVLKAPARPQDCVEWLYGERWQERIAKNKYKTTIVDHRPCHRYL